MLYVPAIRMNAPPIRVVVPEFRKVPDDKVTLPAMTRSASPPKKRPPATVTLPSICVVPVEHSKSPLPPSVTLPRTRIEFAEPAL